ncbi:hypothetical protein M422DRAFT_248309 [Sphaerobolus stellatus SS14]|uniref:Uncharacterized protein n=1 Tax=Sphaerobolus stellatus (strain SS14) TaxID=990650 RepID=A0A0C9VJH3_SPHS4|nr:hypothetical protein M422DRAFT_248309 [Sphaerobolus stellatus SS14]
MLSTHESDPTWISKVIQNFNRNPSGVPHQLHTEGAFINIDNAKVWHWVNLIKPKFCDAEAETLLQQIFSIVGQWEKLVAGQWKRNDKAQFAYWRGCEAGVTPAFAQNKIKPYFIHHVTKLIYNKEWVELNCFHLYESLLPFVNGSPYYDPPATEEELCDLEMPPPDHHVDQPVAGPSSLTDCMDYGGEDFTQPPVNVHDLHCHINYSDNVVPQGTRDPDDVNNYIYASDLDD